jgi:hypothetical protein
MMELAVPTGILAQFLVTAKTRTYAAGGASSSAAVSARLPGSHQLEFREGELLYRDIYFGGAHFAGQEVVYQVETPIWSMCYAGGWTVDLDESEISTAASILQAALRHTPPDLPFRGPLEYLAGDFAYHNQVEGGLARFAGRERIEKMGSTVYALAYTGGVLD